jgi:hypothetical protein
VYPRSARGSQSPDVLSGILAQLLSHMPIKALREADAGAVARQVGLAFIGWILLGSVRSLLRGGSRVLRLARRAPVAAVLLLALSQLMVRILFKGHRDKIAHDVLSRSPMFCPLWCSFGCHSCSQSCQHLEGRTRRMTTYSRLCRPATYSAYCSIKHSSLVLLEVRWCDGWMRGCMDEM